MRTLLLALLIVATPAFAAPERSVSVNADAWVEAIPDILKLSITVKETAANMDEAQRAVARTVPEILTLAREHGVEDGDIDSSRVNAYPEYEHRNNRRIYVGETVTRDIQITLRDPSRYGSLIQQLSELKLHQINGPQMAHSQLDELKLEALKKALAKARYKAGIIAEELDMDLGKVIEVQESGSNATPVRAYRMEAAMADSASGGGFSYGKQRISARVQARFELK